MNPQGQFGQVGQDKTRQFLSAVGNARPDQLDVQTTTKGDVQMNVVNAVNANGIVSGRKVVDFIWQRMAICAIIIAAGCMVAVIVMVFIANAYNINSIEIEADRNATSNKLQELYSSLGVNNQNDALIKLAKDEYFSGDDLKQIDDIIRGKFGATAKIDVSDSSVNFVRINGLYRVVSMRLTGVSNNPRILVYSNTANNVWKLSAYDDANVDNPCASLGDEERTILSKMISCPEIKETE